MDNKLQKLIKILEDGGISIPNNLLDDVDLKSGFNSVFNKLLPERYCNYDTEIIDDENGYYFVIDQHIEATLSEWRPEYLKITGDVDADITIEFSHNKIIRLSRNLRPRRYQLDQRPRFR